jgi:hypothetical protein
VSLSRRELLRRTGALAAGAVVFENLPAALRVQGWLENAYAPEPNVVRQTMNGLVAFIVPGRDRYSRAQGTKTRTAGGIEAGATPALIRTLDRFLPASPPLSSAAATILNEVAANVAPSARRGKFTSTFANLSVAQKAKVFETLENIEGEDAGSIRFLAGNLPGLTAFLAYSEAGAFDRQRRRLRRRPTGWKLTHYAGIADGRPELKGYYEGRRATEPDA